MKKAKKKSKQRQSARPFRDFVEEHRGKRFVLDCGHRATIGDGRSNTIILHPDGKTECHNCGY